MGFRLHVAGAVLIASLAKACKMGSGECGLLGKLLCHENFASLLSD